MKKKLSEKVIIHQTNRQNYLLQTRELIFYMDHGEKLQNCRLFNFLDNLHALQKMINITQINELKEKPKLKVFFIKISIHALYGNLFEIFRKPINFNFIDKMKFTKNKYLIFKNKIHR